MFVSILTPQIRLHADPRQAFLCTEESVEVENDCRHPFPLNVAQDLSTPIAPLWTSKQHASTTGGSRLYRGPLKL